MSDSMRDGGQAMVVHGQTVDPELGRLREEVRRQRSELADLQNRLEEAEQSSQLTGRALQRLRKTLLPMYQALQMVFGEIDAAGVDTAEAEFNQTPNARAAPAGVDPKVAAVWDSWKARFGSGVGKVIDVLLLHGAMSATQLRIACQCRQDTVYKHIGVLKNAGLITKDGGKYNLKQL